VALAARLAFLGSRVAHWDEGRIGYWILNYMQTGKWEYTPILHGPFFMRVDPVVFAAFGTSDFTARLVVALVGGLLPLAAWLFRDRLRDSEVVALALLFAANPILLYYSRFMRNDLLLAAFMLFSLGFFVRLYDTRKRRYLFAGALTLGLAFTTKENVIVYLVTWVGAAGLLLDHRLFSAADRDRDWVDVLRSYLVRLARGVWRWKLPLALALVEFLAIVVFFYAPRPEFDQAFTHLGTWPTVVNDATVGSWEKFVGTWASGKHQSHDYLPYLGHFVKVLGFTAAPLVALSAVGFVTDRYAETGPRDLVAFAFYWGFVSIFGYPLITDIPSPWAPIHVVAPLAIPAAVGGALVYRWGRDAFESDDRVSAALAVVVLLVVAGQVTMVAVNTSYLHPTSKDTHLVQYVQPANDLRGPLSEIHLIAEQTNGTQVLFYGPYAGNWHKRLPLPWYFERYGVNSTKASSPSQLTGSLPPVVIGSTKNQDTLDAHLSGYTKYTRRLAYDDTKDVVIYVNNATLRRAVSLRQDKSTSAASTPATT